MIPGACFKIFHNRAIILSLGQHHQGTGELQPGVYEFGGILIPPSLYFGVLLFLNVNLQEVRGRTAGRETPGFCLQGHGNEGDLGGLLPHLGLCSQIHEMRPAGAV